MERKIHEKTYWIVGSNQEIRSMPYVQNNRENVLLESSVIAAEAILAFSALLKG